MAGPYTDEQIINFIIELRTRPNNPLTENEAIAAVQDTYGISDERISQIENTIAELTSEKEDCELLKTDLIAL